MPIRSPSSSSYDPPNPRYITTQAADPARRRVDLRALDNAPPSNVARQTRETRVEMRGRPSGAQARPSNAPCAAPVTARLAQVPGDQRGGTAHIPSIDP